ncbi:ABC transporter ATP-binding protein [Embleya scabrispora]|uniref:ABC transporter ATP-binding protein n=1 Tax=Embleya scabrispora TaxID=159449 RepID=UPI000373FCD6|nr:ABC transporter ATP-binding protein [Embleya scabrispora]MYS86214.1 ATP-binding cassette domain-containing protein [Streptomyces sp. SID5474]
MTSDTTPVLSVRDLTVTYRTDSGPVTAVERLSFDVAPGETLGIVGESGSGKSAATMAIMGLLPRNATAEGSVLFRGRELLDLSDREMRPIRGKQLAVIFQDALAALNPMMTVGAQVAEAVSVHDASRGSQALRERTVELLDLVGIASPRDRVDQYPHELSGGMRQRVMIAMGIANDPALLIADEPTTALDVTVQAQVLDVIERVQERTHTSVLLITHDLGVVAGIADRVMVMYCGRKLEESPVDSLFHHPAHPYTTGLLGALPRIDRRAERLVQIPGQPPLPSERPTGCPFQPRCPHVVPSVCGDVDAPPLAIDATHTTACVRFHEIESVKR